MTNPNRRELKFLGCVGSPGIPMLTAMSGNGHRNLSARPRPIDLTAMPYSAIVLMVTFI
jgi:hypothetical protein